MLLFFSLKMNVLKAEITKYSTRLPSHSEFVMINYFISKVFNPLDAIRLNQCGFSKWKWVALHARWIVAFKSFWNDEKQLANTARIEEIRIFQCVCLCVICQTSCGFAGYIWVCCVLCCMHTWWWHVGRFTFKNIAKIFDYSETDCILNVKLLWNGGFWCLCVLGAFLNLHFSTN